MSHRERLLPVLIVKNIVKLGILLRVTPSLICVWGPGSGAIFTHWTDQDNGATRWQFPLVYT